MKNKVDKYLTEEVWDQMEVKALLNKIDDVKLVAYARAGVKEFRNDPLALDFLNGMLKIQKFKLKMNKIKM
jgi:hypothetical protein